MTERTTTFEVAFTIDAASAPVGVATLSPDGTIVAVNARLADLLGEPPHALAGRSLPARAASAGEADLLARTIELAIESEAQRCELRLGGMDVEPTWVSLNVWRLPAPGAEARVHVAAEPLPARQGQHHVEMLIDRSPIGMAHVGPDLQLIHLNDRWSAITRQTADDAFGTGWLDVVDGEGRAPFVATLGKCLRSGEGVRGRLRLRTPDGSARWVDVTTTPLASNDGVVISCIDISDELEAARRAEELTRILEATPDLVALLDGDGDEIVWANDALRTLLPEDLPDFPSLLDDWGRAQFRSNALPALVRSGSWRGELTLVADGGELLPISVTLVAHGDDGHRTAISLVARDLSDLRQAERRVLASEVRLAALVEHASELVCVISDTGEIVYASPAATRVLQYPAGVLVGRLARDLVHPDDEPRYAAWMEVLLSAPGSATSIELRVRDAESDWRHLEVVATNLVDNPAVGGIVLNARDVTERVEAATALEARAYHDQLTGLPNRALLLDRLERALTGARARDRLIGVLFIDLDHFKVVNDSLGHAAGDELLREVAHRIHEIVRPHDLVARLGGDEFVIVLDDMTRRGDAMIAARRIRRSIARPVMLADQPAVTTASIGIAVSDGTDAPADLLRDADTALYRAKEEGRDRADLFDDRLRDRAVRRMSVEQRLRRAIEDGTVAVSYQPLIRIDDGSVTGGEALVRLLEPDGTLLEPSEFLDVAEHSGLIIELGQRVIADTCRNLASWARGRPVSVSVNLSARQLADTRLAGVVATELATAQIDPATLCLELTETALIGANPAVEQSLLHLAHLGVRLGLDDFGTGFSSLVHLKRFPIDFVKIDRSFVDGLGTEENDTAIVRATIALAHSLGLQVIAEGVESDAQLQELERLGCDLAQGFLFARPVAGQDFGDYLDLRWTTG